uniref:UDP-glycosyltransferase 76B1-like n=1 Tax=Erigeron canadensis TaxID=72917 RepID=UPI001CB91F02|nr:UDP-glycosyltransferase 76B1-like [Erigeron canadensis]
MSSADEVPAAGGGSSNNINYRGQLVLFPLPFQGHINPMLQLANILHAKAGFKNITIIHTDLNSPNQSNYPQFTFKSISDGLSDESCSLINLDTSNSVINFLNKSCIDPFKACLCKLLAQVVEDDEPPVACLISDALWHFTQSVADSLNLPRIVLRTSSMSCIPAYATFVLGQQSYLKTSSLKQELSLMTEKDRQSIIYKGDSEEGNKELIASMIQETKAASGIILNTFKELEEAACLALTQDFRIPIFPIGPFHKYFPASSSSLLEQDRGSISWLDLQPISSVVYVSFGSIAQVSEAEFSDMAWGLASSNQRFLWVVRPGSVCGSEWLESLPKGFMEEVGERGCIVKWAPQQQVLAHKATGAFWTHSGWNSTLESICEGVPMICSPCSYDQPINARYVTDVWRIGVMLDNWRMNRREIGRAIKRVFDMDNDEGIEMRQRSKSLQHKVNLSLQRGGTAYRSLENLVDHICNLSF